MSKLSMFKRSGFVILTVGVLAALWLVMGASLAQESQGPSLSLEVSLAPAEVAGGDGFLTSLILRNEGSEPAEVDVVTADLPAGVAYVGPALGSDVEDAAEVSASQLRWSGPFTLPAGAELSILYWAVVDRQATPGSYSVTATALTGEQVLVSAESPLTLLAGSPAEVPAARPSPVEREPAEPSAVLVTKTADPEVVDRGSGVIFTVTFRNTGGTKVTLDTIIDYLPGRFEYVGLAPGSQIAQEPTDADAPEIVWEGAFDVQPGGTLVLRYWVWVPPETETSQFPYSNEVTAYYGSNVVGPAYADVMIRVYWIYLPVMQRQETPPTTLPFEDTFDQGLSSNWKVFTNFPGLSIEDWYWWGEAPTWGMYVYDPFGGTGWEGYALSMYLGPGSQEWTDYQVVTTLKNRDARLGGLWVRGTHKEKSDMQGGEVGGYYVHIRPDNEYVFLQRIRPQNLQYYLVDVVATARYAPGISETKFYNLKVQAKGANIKVWLKGMDQPDSAYVLLIDWTDPDKAYMKGTVGFSAFRVNVLFDDIEVTPLSASGQ